MKVLVFEQGSLKATLYWHKQFQDLIDARSGSKPKPKS
jgi:hypothetical protein